MTGIAIVTDSAACLTKELIDQYQIDVIPLTLLSGGKIYRDGVDINPTQAYEMFLKDPDSFKAAPATPEECLATFKKAILKASNILCITLSVKISTLYNVARMALERAKIDLPGVRIDIVDSETASAAEGFIALAAARAVQAGKNLDDVIETALHMKERVHALVLLDTVRYVYRSGRVPRIAAQAASVLNIRPLFNLYGTVHFVTATRSRTNGIERMLKMMRDKTDGRPLHCSVMHAYELEEARKIKEKVNSEFNCVEIWISEFSPIMGYATGTGTLGLAFYAD
jgi:DegV family protein with EDD domain